MTEDVVFHTHIAIASAATMVGLYSLEDMTNLVRNKVALSSDDKLILAAREISSCGLRGVPRR